MVTVFHHSADFDGEFCREIACKFLPMGTPLIGWDFSDARVEFPAEGTVYVLDLPYDRLFSNEIDFQRLIWIDHHKSSLQVALDAGQTVRGYQIDGVAACRLAWQWFRHSVGPDFGLGPKYLPTKDEYLTRAVYEPLAVRLAGEYDVWDHRDNKEDIDFQYGLRAQEKIDWYLLLEGLPLNTFASGECIAQYLRDGKIVKRYSERGAQAIGKKMAFNVRFEGLNFIALNTQARNSMAIDFMATSDHDALMTFSWNGPAKEWRVSMYGNGKDIDLSEIAKKYGGGGHKNACGFQTRYLPWLPS